MGLAGEPKVRQQIYADPRNTAWANNTGRLGYKLLSSFGWTEGAGLGQSLHGQVQNIKVLVKDDTLGIGAKASNDLEWSGLGEFNAIFGRLNNDSSAFGVSQETLKVQRVQDEKLDAKKKNLNSVALARRFVLGGTFTSEFAEWMKEQQMSGGKSVTITEIDSKHKHKHKSKSKEEKKKKKSKDETEAKKHHSSKNHSKKHKSKHTEAESDSDASVSSTTSTSTDMKSKHKHKSSSQKKSKSKSSKHKDKSSSSPSRKRKRDEKENAEKSNTVAVHLAARRKFLAQKRAAVQDPAALKAILGIH
ncbi:ribosome biogenesis protein [Schizosaccharomyces japonicus yFS275]|uniref:PinX1-related protein 1 n=1 Tax=Schizosaccharomyces japonicus (strain yFS275 / FY16936) TaxID=402676 RepID=B6K136_SCHJY|nr:ribosome biogenesis protein [Schizosaccharomyces japonicus yFS275]EEB07657.2 ribosome biogenesis protein [Schizosaccharomyces japonicus yFS275]